MARQDSSIGAWEPVQGTGVVSSYLTGLMLDFHESFYLRMPPGPTTQGDIWSGLSWCMDDASMCTGLIITPRCDLSHNKSPVVNYLPIVPISDFMRSDGGFRLAARELKRVVDVSRNVAQEARVTAFVDLGMSVAEIASIKSPEVSDTAAALKLRKQLNALQEQEDLRKTLENAIASGKLENGALRDLIPEKELTKFLSDVIRNNISDVHFIPPYPHLLPFPSVVLLRHVLTAPIAVLKIASECRRQEDWAAASAGNPIPGYPCNSVLPERILRVKSPFIESTLARFAALYGRIGVRDIDADELESFVEESKRQCGY